MTEAPNHALQRTAPHVTAPASGLRLAPTAQVPRRAPRSLSLGSLGHSTRMESSDITKLIQTELSSTSRALKSGVSLDRCLVTPQRMTFAGHAEGDTWDLWLVLEEQPETKSGYKIVFDEETKQFGLASGTRNVFIGFYGTFVETLEGM